MAEHAQTRNFDPQQPRPPGKFDASLKIIDPAHHAACGIGVIAQPGQRDRLAFDVAGEQGVLERSLMLAAAIVDPAL
jgi:hypothetical protein